MSICKTVIMHPNARIGKNVKISSYSIIGDCMIGDNCILHPHSYIGDNVIIDEGVEIFNGAIIGKEPRKAGSITRNVSFCKTIHIGKNASIGTHAVIYYDVKIGENTLIGDGASIREKCDIGNFCIISRYVTLNYNVKIGNNVKIMDLSHITGNSNIEDNVFISALVGTANDNKIVMGYGDHIVGQNIRKNAIIGLGAKILPNIEIGYNSQVAAGAVVTRDVPKEKLVLGIPAKECIKLK